MEPTEQLDLISSLPIELAQIIFLSLDVQSILKSERVRKKWNYLINNYMWKINCKNHNFKEIEVNQHGYKRWSTKHIYWKGVFLYHHTLRNNWLTKSLTKYMSETKGTQILDCSNSSIIEAGVSGTINIINSYGKTFRSKQGFGKPVSFAKIQNEHILSLYGDELLVMWSIHSLKDVWRIECSQGYDIAVDFYQEKVAVNSKYQNFVYLMNIKSKRVKFRLKHAFRVTRVNFYEDKLVCGCGNGGINVWNPNNGKLIYQFKNFKRSEIVDIAINGIYAACRSSNNTILVWNINTGEKLHNFTGTSINFLDNKTLLFVESNRQFVTVVNCKSGKCLARIDNDEEVQEITVNSKFIFIKSALFIKMYDVISKKLERSDTTLCMNSKTVISFKASNTKLAITFRGDQKLTSIILDFDVNTP